MEEEDSTQELKCRCCFVSIKDKSQHVKLTEKLIQLCEVLIQIRLQALVSDVICTKCDEKIREFCEFKAMILETQNRFETMIKKESTNDELRPFEVSLENTILKAYQKPKRKADVQSHFCPICNKYFTETRKVKLHIARIHLQRKDYKCDLCSYSAFKKYDILLHLNNIHKPEGSIEETSICPTCGFSFKSNSRLNIHIRRKHQENLVRKLSCDLCRYRASALNEIKRHVKTHLPKDLKETHPCIECGAMLSSKGSLKIHRDSKHSDMPSIVCFCGKSFRQKSVYTRHYQVLHKGIKAFKCDYCSKNFSGKSHLLYHTKAFHSMISAITCEICGNKYKNEETLKKHFIYHSDPKFDCKMCGKKFHEKKKLLDHMSAHEKLEFSCQNCSRSFRLESQLRYHLKKVHFKEKTTFQCELCSSTFTRRSSYREHASRQHKELDKEEKTAFFERIRKVSPLEQC